MTLAVRPDAQAPLTDRGADSSLVQGGKAAAAASLPAGSPTVDRVLKSDLCAGCGLCASLSNARMAENGKGFARPGAAAAVSAATENAIAAACPGTVVAPWGPAPHSHPVWGPYHTVAVGHAVDADVRHRGSSGGGVTALALFALESGLVDRVIQVAADPDRPTQNIATVSTTCGEIVTRASSRYAASAPLALIDAELAKGGAIAFVGKPCDVSALRQFAKTDRRVDRHVKLMLSFFCAGVPSERGARKILDAMGVEEDELARFRYRGHGWPGFATAVTTDGRRETMSYAESWGQHLARELQFRCKICPDAVGGVADIVCADAWYGDEGGYPTFDEQPGRSLFMVRTARGRAVFDGALGAGDLAAEPLDVHDIDRMQPAQARRKRLIGARTLAMRLLGRRVPGMAGLKVREAAGLSTRAERLRDFLGTARRVLKGAGRVRG